MSELTPFELIGGQSAVDRLIDTFYHYMDTVPEARDIRALHPADLTPIIAILKKYLAEWLGGPRLYSAERGHPRLRMRHLPFPIREAERDAWLFCMRKAMNEVVESAELRTSIMGNLEKLADWMRNDTPPHTSA